MTDAELARTVATEAGRLLMRLQVEGAGGAVGDREANRLILDRLGAERPDDCVLSEESADDPARLSARRLWVVDPLDGTREFAEGRGDWAVHVALAIDGAPAIGAVALPALDFTLATDMPPPLVEPHDPLRMLVSRTRPPRIALDVAEAIGAELVAMGSAGAKAMAVLRGEADIYLHSGGQYAWDNCAPAAVALAAGLHASRINGSPLIYNRPDVSVPDLLICRRELAPRLLGLVRELGPAEA